MTAIITTESDDQKTLTVRHNMDRENYHCRVVVHFKDSKTEVLGLNTPDSREAIVTEQAANPLSADGNYVTLEWHRCYWAEIFDIVLRPAPADPKYATLTNPVRSIELKAAEQQLEKTLVEMQELQTALASMRKTKSERQVDVVEAHAKLSDLQAQAERLREVIRLSTAKQ